LGGHAEAAIRRAAEIADGFVCIEDEAVEIARVFDVMARSARQSDRKPDELRFTVMLNAFIGEDGDDLWSLVRPGVNHQWGTYEAWDAGHDTPDHDSMQPIPDEDAERSAIVLGTPVQLAEQLGPIVDAYGSGSSPMDLVVRLHYPGMAFDVAARAVELFAERVIPALAR
jgi:alkanesulfonate monooxygenase SsuD/methylene tetrahydromethanopterin reductase-like flavin-dependent oxidoreductase (luciferase family)